MSAQNRIKKKISEMVERWWLHVHHKDFNMIKVCNSLHMRKLFYSCRLRVSVPERDLGRNWRWKTILIHMHEPQWSAVRITTHLDRFEIVKYRDSEKHHIAIIWFSGFLVSNCTPTRTQTGKQSCHIPQIHEIFSKDRKRKDWWCNSWYVKRVLVL